MTLIRVAGLRKHYGGVQALGGVDLDIRAGEVHGVVGANGAGKSTLIKILAGLETPDAGEIEVDGAVVAIATPDRATALGLSFIHQELNLVPQMTALQNIVLGMPKPHRYGLVDWRQVRRAVQSSAARVGIRFSLERRAASLGVAERWLVSICRALVRRFRLIVMDEPTASLSEHECDNLFRIVRDLSRDGVAVLYVSHRLDGITGLCDRVTVFRDGRLTARIDRAALTRARLSRPSSASRRPRPSLRRLSRRRAMRWCSASAAFDAAAWAATSASTCGAARCSASAAWSAPGAARRPG